MPLYSNGAFIVFRYVSILYVLSKKKSNIITKIGRDFCYRMSSNFSKNYSPNYSPFVAILMNFPKMESHKTRCLRAFSSIRHSLSQRFRIRTFFLKPATSKDSRKSGKGGIRTYFGNPRQFNIFK